MTRPAAFLLAWLGLAVFAGSLRLAAQPAASPFVLALAPATAHDLSVSNLAGGVYEIRTAGSDPFVATVTAAGPLPLAQLPVLTFEYLCAGSIDPFVVYFGPGWSEAHHVTLGALGRAEGWVTASFDLRRTPNPWTPGTRALRLDFGNHPGVRLQLRNLRLRAPTAGEAARVGARDAHRAAELALDRRLRSYLDQEFPGRLTRVAATTNTITLQGSAAGVTGQFFLVEVPLWEHVMDTTNFLPAFALDAGTRDFSRALERFVPEAGGRRDRALSRWALARPTGAGGWELLSHARYCDDQPALHDWPDERPRSKKGLGGFHAGSQPPVSDLDELGITSVTVNICLNFLRDQPGPAHLAFESDGRTYYADRGATERLDATLLACSRRRIVVDAILLVNKADGWASPALSRAMTHPDCDPAGIYSMANVATAEGVRHYVAAVEFLARRYSEAGALQGRIHNWIVHNEVDAGWVWTNCGEKPALLFLDQYHKVLRATHLTVRRYAPHARVFASFTHFWTRTEDRRFYHTRDLLDFLLEFSRAEGDFDWAIAHHPYPESLFEPKSWRDKQAEFHFDTPLITFKNLEVLDAWVNQPRTFYLGQTRRRVHLSEQGPNSPDYSDRALAEQAAAMAYAWKKFRDLDAIEAFQFHNWMDNRGEGGLRIGLRRFPDDATDPGGRKPVWFTYQKLGTPEEDAACAFALPIIGVTHWNEIRATVVPAPGATPRR